MDETSLPGNSFKERLGLGPEPVKDASPRAQVTPVVSEPARLRKKPVLSRIFGDGLLKDVASYVVFDILVPAAKAMLVDSVISGIQMTVYGETRRIDSRVGGSRTSRISYGEFFDRDLEREREWRKTGGRYAQPRLESSEFDKVLFRTYSDAAAVVAALDNLIEKYEVARVADFYATAGMSHDFTDNNYGWNNLSETRIVQVGRDGFIVRFPPTIRLD